MKYKDYDIEVTVEAKVLPCKLSDYADKHAWWIAQNRADMLANNLGFCFERFIKQQLMLDGSIPTEEDK